MTNKIVAGICVFLLGVLAVCVAFFIGGGILGITSMM